MPTTVHPIIVWYNPSTQNLSVYPDSVTVKVGDTIVWWDITPQDIQSIQISRAGHIFTATLPPGNWNGFPVVVRNVGDVVWKYSITGQSITHGSLSLDPKIAVKSRPLINIFIIGIPILAALIVLIARQYFIRAKIKFAK